MGYVKHLIVWLAMLGSSSTLAQTVNFQSKEELFQAFYRAGFDRIIELKYGDFDQNQFLIHTPEDYKDEGTKLRLFAAHHDEIVRVPSLDYMHGTMSYNKSPAEAYIYSEVFLCYLKPQSAIGAFFSQGERKFLNCLVFPVKIVDVLKAVQALPKPVPLGAPHAGRIGH